MKHFLSAMLILFALLVSAPSSFAQGTTQSSEQPMTGVVTSIREEKLVHFEDRSQLYQQLDVLITDGKEKGKTVAIENGNIPLTNVVQYHNGDAVLVTLTRGPDNKASYYISDFVRTPALYWLFGIFIFFTLLVGRKQGFLSLIGMGFSFLIIFTFLLPQILAGNDPVLIAIITALTIIPITFFLSHGLSKKTIAAMIGTGLALVLTGILAALFVDLARLTGFASEEANFVQAIKGGGIDIRGLLLSGIIIGALGVLDDITITQAAIVAQLKKTAPDLSFSDVFVRSMAIGRDHIASVVNTLILVYTGASLPLLLLFMNNPLPFGHVMNYELIAEEVVRTLTASIGLILAIPLTTFLADFLIHEVPVVEEKQKKKEQTKKK